jgi:hypothetical protein
MYGASGSPFPPSYLGDTATLVFRNGEEGALNHMPGCPNYAHQMPLVASLVEGGNTYAAVSENEVIRDLICGGKAKGTHLWLPLSKVHEAYLFGHLL